MRKYLLLIALVLLIGCMPKIDNSLIYIDKNKPSLTPKIFAPNFISKNNEYEYGSIFSKNGTQFFYGVNVNGKAEIRFTQLKNKRWTEPIIILSHSENNFGDPMLSPNEKELYYISDRPVNDLDTLRNHNIWYSKKMGDQWSEPILVGDEINSDKNEYYISFNRDGTLYYASNKNAEAKRNHDFDIYASDRIGDKYIPSIKLSDSINTKRYEADVFIDPGESYIIFCSARKEGLGKGDLYISFKDKNGHWLKAINMGTTINSEHHELCPFVTRDGQYFFYTSNEDIYWVDAAIIEQFRPK